MCALVIERKGERTMATKKSVKEMARIVGTIPRLLVKNSGICEFYTEGDISIGVSYEDTDRHKEVYIFNLFYCDEYVNIPCVYKRVNGEFTAVEGQNLIEILTSTWNEWCDFDNVLEDCI